MIDTSAWIEFFRAKGDFSIKSRVAEILSQNCAAFTCPVYYELFLGARPSEIADLRTGLGYAERLPLRLEHWNQAAEYGSELRAKGVTVPASDLLIATVANEENALLFACDKHFEIIRTNAIPELKLA